MRIAGRVLVFAPGFALRAHACAHVGREEGVLVNGYGFVTPPAHPHP
jgi:hypothetical protein